MKRPTNIFVKFILNIFGYLGILLIIFLLACLAKFLYMPSKPVMVPEDIPVDKFSKSIAQPMKAGHFHILDETEYSDEINAPMCLTCHGNFCHDKSEELRSFYNMHTFYLACETCHIRKKEGEQMVFKWFDNISGEPLKEAIGWDGSYGAKIVPVSAGKRLDNFPKKKLALEYMRLEGTYSEDEKKKVQEELMEHISKEALSCGECHQKDGYLNLSTLGYGQTRISRLTRLEIMQLIDEYKEFYLPTMFMPPKER